MGKFKIWSTQEDDVLVDVVKNATCKKWKKAAEELQKKGFNRTDVQCRERYINHLDQKINKSEWSEDELQIFYSKYGQYKNKWFLISQHLPGRTQTKIKNYFYGQIRLFLKIGIIVILREEPGFINDIKTNILIDIYEGKNQFEGHLLIQRSIKKLKYRIEKEACEKFILENRQAFEEFIHYFQITCSANSVPKNIVTRKSQKQKGRQAEDDSNSPEQSVGHKLVPIKVQLLSSTRGQFANASQKKVYFKEMIEFHQNGLDRFKKLYQSMMEQQNQVLMNEQQVISTE